MRKLVLVFGILAGVVSVSMGAMSEEEVEKKVYGCFQDDNPLDSLASCAELLLVLPSVEGCQKTNCVITGNVYRQIGGETSIREAIRYYEKAIALGDIEGYVELGITYDDKLQDYFNAKKYYEIACNKGDRLSCFNLGGLYKDGQGVFQEDSHKAHELWKKACDLKLGEACLNVGVSYENGYGVRQNLSTAKQYYGKACDLGYQRGCDNYKGYNERGW